MNVYSVKSAWSERFVAAMTVAEAVRKYAAFTKRELRSKEYVAYRDCADTEPKTIARLGELVF